jgi:hypothetical protein
MTRIIERRLSNRLSVIALVAIFMAFPCDTAHALDPRIKPAPEPFSLDAYSAVQAVWMLRRTRYLRLIAESDRATTVPVRSVRVTRVQEDPDPAPPDEARYDILLNGTPLDWDNLYIYYNRRMINLRLLFTYRNQRPVPGDRFLLDEYF